MSTIRTIRAVELRKLDNMRHDFFKNTICRRVMAAARRIQKPESRKAWMQATKRIKKECLTVGPPGTTMVYARLRKYAVLPATENGSVLCNENGTPVFRKVLRYTEDHRVVLGGKDNV